MAASSPASRRWLYGPVPDLLLGCGVGYTLLLLGFLATGSAARTTAWSLSVPFLVLLFGAPHYGATLVRVYQNREDRRAYALFTVWITLALIALFVVGVHQGLVGSLIVTIYLTWVPWHYTGQNYGIAVMFLRRRGVPLPPTTKRLLYASFVLSYGLAFLALHTATGTTGLSPLSNYDPSTYRLLTLGIPAAAGGVLIAGIAGAFVVVLIAAVVSLRRNASIRDLVPALLLVGTQALWFSIPIVVRRWEMLPGVDSLTSQHGAYYFLWIAIAHSVQYVWLTAYYARKSERAEEFPGWFLKIMLVGASVWIIPGLLFAPDALGRLPYDAGLGALVAATVNLHHFILDGAIWKLRNVRVASILVRDGSTPESGAGTGAIGGWPPWMRGVGFLVGGCCLFVMGAVKWEEEFGVRRASLADDVPRMELAMDRLTWLGRDSANRRYRLGASLRQRDPEAARIAFERSVELRPNPAAFVGIGGFQEREEHWEQALESYEAALRIDPNLPRPWYRKGLVSLELGDVAEAVVSLERAVALAPEENLYKLSLKRAHRLHEENSSTVE